ncbi:uncharacterized protein BJ171DRAFT_423045, partial [Polychytrium aggregatum]|uniref:uncharacterized protein n=1 Tax=Polychytrium aggregatum TaxID=110093 RepID=UPI0022FEAF13
SPGSKPPRRLRSVLSPSTSHMQPSSPGSPRSKADRLLAAGDAAAARRERDPSGPESQTHSRKSSKTPTKKSADNTPRSSRSPRTKKHQRSPSEDEDLQWASNLSASFAPTAGAQADPGSDANDDRGPSQKDPEPARPELSHPARRLAAALADSGFDESQLSAILEGSGLMNSELASMLEVLKRRPNPTMIIGTLQELAEMLSMATGKRRGALRSSDWFPVDRQRPEIGLQLDFGAGNSVPDLILLTCRCLSNLIEALPSSTIHILHHGGVKILVSKLMEVEFIDLAEQVLSVLEKVSVDYPSPIIQANGLCAVLQYIDFFNIHVQRTAVTIAANACREPSTPDQIYSMIRDVMPIVERLLAYSDHKLVEQVAKMLGRIVDWCWRQGDKLEGLVSSTLLKVLVDLVISMAASEHSNSTVITQLLKIMSTIAKGSPRLGMELLSTHPAVPMIEILLVGDGTRANGVPIQESEKLASNVMKTVIGRPVEQLLQLLVLASDLLPNLPSDGLFQMSASARSEGEAEESALLPILADSSTPKRLVGAASIGADQQRRLLLQEQPLVLEPYLSGLVPVLMEVFGATMNAGLRRHAVECIVKSVWFTNPARLGALLIKIPGFGKFVSELIGLKEHARDALLLVVSGVQIMEIVSLRGAKSFEALFIREGAVIEIEKLLSLARTARDRAHKLTVRTGDDHPSRTTSLPSVEPTEVPLFKREAVASFSGERYTELDTWGWIIERCQGLIKAQIKDRPHDVANGGSNSVLAQVRAIAEILSGSARISSDKSPATLEGYLQTLCSLAQLIVGGGPSSEGIVGLTAFEILESGVLDALSNFMTCPGPGDLIPASLPDASLAYSVPLRERFRGFLHVFMNGPAPGRVLDNYHVPQSFALLVKRLQETLGRTEKFELALADMESVQQHQSGSNPGAQLNRQIRIRLSPKEDHPRSKDLASIVVSVHAVATFRTIEEYLLTRVLVQEDSMDLGVVGSRLARRLQDAAGLPRQLSGQPSINPSAKAGTAAPERVSGALETTSAKTKGLLQTEMASEEDSEMDQSFREYAERMLIDGEDEDDEDEDENGFGDDDDDEEEEEDEVDASGLFGREVHKQPIMAREEKPSIVSTSATSDSRYSSLSVSVSPPKGKSGPEPRAPATSSTVVQKPGLEFSLGEQVLSNDSTVFGALYSYESKRRSGDGVPATPINVWSQTYTIEYTRVSRGEPARPSISHGSQMSIKLPFHTEVPESIAALDIPSRILKLMRILHGLNTRWEEVYEKDAEAMAIHTLPASAFISNKLAAKVNRQLDEPLIVASKVLPSWCESMVRDFGFLFPFKTRLVFLQSTSFGHPRCLSRWQPSQGSAASAGLGSRAGHSEAPAFGRVPKQKVRLARVRLVESMMKVMELYGTDQSLLEIEFFDEVGTGLGPTIEFYTLTSRELQRLGGVAPWRNSNVVADQANGSVSEFVDTKLGLFPAPIDYNAVSTRESEALLTLFRHLGTFVAKALLDNRMIDLPLSPIFLEMAAAATHHLLDSAAQHVDTALYASLLDLRKYAEARKRIQLRSDVSDEQKRTMISQARVREALLSDLGLDFTLPGYPEIELCPSGSAVAVDMENIDDYIEQVVEYTAGKGVRQQIEAFRQGFVKVFPITDLRAFTVQELGLLIGGAENEDWSYDAIYDALKADHGYSKESKTIAHLCQIMSEYSLAERREFMQFVTGSPKLPVGGFKALSPPLTVVRKTVEEHDRQPDDYLPSVMTCVNYLKVPDYTSKSVMKSRFEVAVKEGQGCFHLS